MVVLRILDRGVVFLGGTPPPLPCFLMAGRAYVKIPDPQEGPLQARPSGLSFEGRNSFSLLLGCEIRFLDDVGNLWVAKFDQLDKCWVFFTPARLWGSADLVLR